MVSLELLNELRERAQWSEIRDKCREHLKEEADASFVLRALAQALEKLNEKGEEFEGALVRLLELKDRVTETAMKLGRYYRETRETEEAIRHLEIALESSAADRQYDILEDLWLELVELAPSNLVFYNRIAETIAGYKQNQRAAVLLQMLLGPCEERKDWEGRFFILKRILRYTPKDESLREPIVDTLRKLYNANHEIERVFDHASIRGGRPLPEALEEVELLTKFLPDSFVRHPDWGIGRVKDLDMGDRRVSINFQKKRDHRMDLELAQKAVETLHRDDFRVLRLIDSDRIASLVKDNPIELIKIVLKSFGGSALAKEIKEQLVPSCIPARLWTAWWSETNSLLRRDPYIAVVGGVGKRYTLREHAASDEDELLKRFDETKAPHAKVDQIYQYVRTTKKEDLHTHVIRHFSKKIHAIAPRRPSPAERAELWFANEDLKEYAEGIESLPDEVLDDTLKDLPQTVNVLQHLRFKSHQLRYAQRLKAIHSDHWPDIFREWLLEPNVEVRDELAAMLEENYFDGLIAGMVDETLSEYRKYPHTFIWLTNRSLTKGCRWMEGKVQNPILIDRLLLLIDYLTSQAKRREKDEAAWLRKVAGDARELIRRNRYALFKEHIQDAGENIAQSIYRRAQTNEGIDKTTAMDLTAIVRGRYPNLFQHSTEETAMPDGLLCLKPSYERKQALLKRLIEKDLPAVVQEIETARKHGDLKENAEYHAAKDKQKLLAAQTGELQEQMHLARPVEIDDVNTDSIRFGTLFRVSPLGSEAREEYVMLGPWESNPEHFVLSYQAPFARGFLNKYIGEIVDIELPLHTGRYEILSIEKIPDERVQEILRNLEKLPTAAALEAAAEMEELE
ncbi:MAG: GreA/GreB family elongation factor [Candidatus Omnitrophota bacterium]